MKNKISLIFVLLLSLVQGIKSQQTSDHFSIEGDIANTLEIGPDQLSAYPSVSLDSMIIFSHDMKAKRVMRKIKGILLRDILSKVSFNVKTAKELSAYYIECIGTDGYKVLFSWNELFNSETGDHTMIVTEKDGSGYATQNDRIALITPTDRATGRRYVKSLGRIVIQRVK